VRPNGTGFEIGAGHRRARAAKLAQLTEVPCVVKPMDDVQFLELLVFENDHREDVHPLEEAEGYRSLMTHAKYDVAKIAERLGRSVKYVYDRVKLLQLITPAKTLFLEGKLTAGHAILLARLKPDDQRRALGDPKQDYDGGGVFEHEDLLFSPDSEEYDQGLTDVKPVSVRELAAWIDKNVRFDVAAADPMLFPETVQTVTAAKGEREKVVQITHEHYVERDARDPKTRTISPRSWKRADGVHQTKRCDKAVTGVIVAGAGRGEAFKVCLDKKGCAIHWGLEQKEAKRRAKLLATGRRGDATDRWKREEARRKAEEAREEAERARWKKALPAILTAVAAKVKKAPARAAGWLAQVVVGECVGEHWDRPTNSADYVGRGTTAEDLVRHAAFLVLHREAANEYHGPRDFPKRAKALGVDVRKILDEVAPAPVQTAAKAGSAKKGSAA
jgi:ParB/RepB/Spo0J family partition protein